MQEKSSWGSLTLSFTKTRLFALFIFLFSIILYLNLIQDSIISPIPIHLKRAWSTTVLRNNSLLFQWLPINKVEELKYFTRTELASIPLKNSNMGKCNKYLIAEACCLGTRSSGGGNGRHGGCYANISVAEHMFVQQFPIDYKRRFVTSQTTELYDMSDVVTVLNNKRLLVIGDSVMNQNFDNLICDLQRHMNVPVVINWHDRRKKNWVFGTSVRMEISVKETNTTLIFHREFRFSTNGLTIKEACTNVDVLVLNYGVHWNDLLQYKHAIKDLASYLLKYCSDTNIVFRGSTAQHFPTFSGRYSDNKSVLMGFLEKHDTSKAEELRTTNKKLWEMGCFPLKEPYSETRDDVAFKVFEDGGFEVLNALTMNEEDWKNKAALQVGKPIILFIPFENMTRPLYDFHFKECTHYCNSPHMWSGVYHFLYKYVSALYKSNATFESKQLYIPKPWKINKTKNDPNYQIPELAFKNSTIYKN